MKKLKVTNNEIDDMLKDIKDILTKASNDNKFESEITFDLSQYTKIDEKQRCELKFTATAYLKMLTYVLDSNKEIAWHGLVTRTDDTHFVVTDVMLYPQMVTGATVDTDDLEYAQWTETLTDEEFNTLRFQGHSHVNMATNPSGVDTKFYAEKIEEIHNNPDEYYIFLIMNKSKSMWINIHDLKNGILYEKEDIDFVVGEDILGKATKDIANFVKQKTYTTTTNTTSNTTSNTTPATKSNSSSAYTNYSNWQDDWEWIDNMWCKKGTKKEDTKYKEDYWYWWDEFDKQTKTNKKFKMDYTTYREQQIKAKEKKNK